jgi:hypothetical protein
MAKKNENLEENDKEIAALRSRLDRLEKQQVILTEEVPINPCPPSPIQTEKERKSEQFYYNRQNMLGEIEATKRIIDSLRSIVNGGPNKIWGENPEFILFVKEKELKYFEQLLPELEKYVESFTAAHKPR